MAQAVLFPELLQQVGSSRPSGVFESELRGASEAQHGEVAVAGEVLRNEDGAE